MIITQDTDDQLCIMGFFRYSLPRHSYILRACQDFLRNHWNQLTVQTQDVIIRDIAEFLFDSIREENQSKIDRKYTPYLSNLDNKSWQQFLIWAWQNINDEQKQWARNSCSWKGNIDILISDTIEINNKLYNVPKTRSRGHKNDSR